MAALAKCPTCPTALNLETVQLVAFDGYRRAASRKNTAAKLRKEEVASLSDDIDWPGHSSNSDELRPFQGDDAIKPTSLVTPSATPSTTVSDGEFELRRVNTLGDIFEDSARLQFCRQVSACSDAASICPLNEGQTGEVFAVVDEMGEKVAVFKPASREHFHRREIVPGQGAIREEAAYVVDRLGGGHGGVPITTQTELEVMPGVTESGALQAFVQGHEGYIEDYAMPWTLKAAAAFVSIEQAEAIAILDIRIFNTDRHGGNLLLSKSTVAGGSHGLVPIDHGCCLPPWWSLSEGNFEAWRGWPQLRVEPTAHARALVTAAVESLPATVDSLLQMGLCRGSVATLQLCTLLLEVGVLQRGLPLDKLAGLMQRDDESLWEEPSWFEKCVTECASEAEVEWEFALEMRLADDGIFDMEDEVHEPAQATSEAAIERLLCAVRRYLEEKLPAEPSGCHSDKS